MFENLDMTDNESSKFVHKTVFLGFEIVLFPSYSRKVW